MKIKWNPIRTQTDLPKSGRRVLVTFRARGRRYVGMNETIPKSMRYGTDDDDLGNCWAESLFEPIAWAELPEPYVGVTE